MGHIVFYAGGDAKVPCGDIIVADHVVAGSATDDPNRCA